MKASTMGFFGSIFNGIWFVISFIISILWKWLSLLFVVPFRDFDIFWILIPIWLSWFFAEFFQEKKGSSFGNVISNGAVAVWVGIDWMRQIIDKLLTGARFGWGTFGKISVSLIALAYGILIIVWGIKANKLAHLLGRIREVTYVLLVFSPIVYGIVTMSWKLVLAMLVGAPIFYFTIEYIDKLLPDPTAVKKDLRDAYEEEEEEEEEEKEKKRETDVETKETEGITKEEQQSQKQSSTKIEDI